MPVWPQGSEVPRTEADEYHRLTAQQEYSVQGPPERYFTASEDTSVVALRDAIQGLAALIDVHVPVGRNKALALTALEDVQMRANRGIFAPDGLR